MQTPIESKPFLRSSFLGMLRLKALWEEEGTGYGCFNGGWGIMLGPKTHCQIQRWEKRHWCSQRFYTAAPYLSQSN